MTLQQVVLSESEQNAAAVEGVAKISPLPVQHSQIESFYLSQERQVSLKPEFEESLIDPHVKILEYQICMASHCARSNFVRMLRAVPKLDDWDGMIQGIKAKDSTCKEFARIFDPQGSHFNQIILNAYLKSKQ